MYCILCLQHGLINLQKPNFCICENCFNKAVSIATKICEGGQ